jgi:hypothetical protein
VAVTGAQGTCLLVGSCETQASPVVKIVPEFLLDGDLQMTFEGAFTDTERAASSATKSVADLAAALKQLQKAAAEGNLADMHKSAEKLTVITQSVCQEVENTKAAWPFTPDAEEHYFRESYANEILEAARANNIQIQRLDDGYLVYPSVLRILPSERTVTIDRKKIQAVRPSRLMKILKTVQTAKPKVAAEQFLELLHRTYRLLTSKEYGKTIALAAVYECLTLLPGSGSTYGQTEFARDLFLLDRSGITRTRSGANVSLPASTGTKTGKGTFSFVSPDGDAVTYYGIQFVEGTE